MYQQIGIVGVGLIGASIGRAVKKRHLARRVIGVGRSAESLARALDVGAIDEAHTRIGPELASVDFLIVATPVPLVVDVVERAWTVLRPDAIITDAASTKLGIVEDVERRRPADRHVAAFVGSHPMAGSHKRGPDASSADLFDRHTCIVVDDPGPPPSARDQVIAFWRGLGMRVETMPAAVHDERVARISHLPHAVSYALALSAEAADARLAGPGFRDTTRLAASPPGLWTDIFRENRSAVLGALARFQDRLRALTQCVEREDWTGLEKTLTDANDFVDKLHDLGSSPPPPSTG